MVTENDTRAIDPEFAFYGPMGFDIGAVLANLFMAYFSQVGHEKSPGERTEYAQWILQQANVVWNTFEARFGTVWQKAEGRCPAATFDSGCACAPQRIH